jgi:hypothetical protein
MSKHKILKINYLCRYVAPQKRPLSSITPRSGPFSLPSSFIRSVSGLLPGRDRRKSHSMVQSHSAAQPKPAEGIRFPAVTAVTSTLPNGLGVIVQEDHSAPVASVQVWVETGSIHEGRHLGGGLSHLLEHMLFKGTPSRGASAFAQSVQDAGGYINAYTSFDRTVYWIDIPAKGVPVALELLADAVMNSTLPADEYVKEQEVIRRVNSPWGWMTRTG